MTKHVLSPDLMFLVYAMGAYYDWHHGRYNPNPDYREEPGPFEPPSAEKPDPQDEEVRHEVEELAETAAHDYADADLSEDEKESVRKAKGKSKKTLERIKLSSRGQTDAGVLDTKILKTYSSDGAPGQCDYCRSNGNDTPVVTAFFCRMCGLFCCLHCREVGTFKGLIADSDFFSVPPTCWTRP